MPLGFEFIKLKMVVIIVDKGKTKTIMILTTFFDFAKKNHTS